MLDFRTFKECMVVREASNYFFVFEILLFSRLIALSSMALSLSGFERLEFEWIFCMYPAGRRLSHSKLSFETAVQSHLLAPLFYRSDNRFIRKAEC